MSAGTSVGRGETADRRGAEPCSQATGRNTGPKLDGGEVKVLCKY